MNIQLGLALTLAWTITHASPATAAGCGDAELAALRTAAQSLDPRTPELGETLLACEDRRAEVGVWVSFYFDAKQDYARLQAFERRLAALGHGKIASPSASRAAVLAVASAGDLRELERRTAAGQSGFANDAEAQLVLARGRTRVRRYEDARRAYARYGELKPDDDEIRIEGLYTYVWEGQHERCFDEFTKALDGKLSPAAKAAAERGRPLCEPAAPAAAAASGSLVGLHAEGYGTSDKYERRGIGLHWRDPLVELSLTAHRIGARTFGEHLERRANELVAARRFTLGTRFDAGGQVGVWASHKSLLVFDLSAGWRPTPIWRLEIGGAQSPLGKFVGLLDPDADAVDRMGFAGLAWREALSYRFERHEIKEFAPYDRHQVKGRYVVAERGNGTKVTLLAEARRTEHPRPNPLIYSPWRETLLAAGFGLQARPEDVRLAAELLAGTYDIQLVDEKSKVTPVVAYLAKLTAAYDLDTDLRAGAEVVVARSENAPVLSTYHSTYARLTLDLLFDASERGARP